MPTLGRDDYWDRVYACWMGKNCGGTLGAPLEKAFAQDEPFAIDWYTELRDGGIPNDDLEMQLIWLKAVEEQGFGLTARELAQYWLDHIGYNWDEYGLNKTNLRLGLAPPVSGSYNNWFRDCMGAPIRSELWACLAPGSPVLAVRYAYEDATVDHAGGEGVWGEVFNAALQSAAFVERDPATLLDIALGYIPPDCVTAHAVRAARAAHASGMDWREARRRVMSAAPHYVAQYAPTNMGFQVLGWLYGKDFGDALCTTVNCGYDTDCTGATVGALLGILGGRAGLPERWTAPLGEGISTNESWGGLSNTSTGPNPVPATLTDLTNRICALGLHLLAREGSGLAIGERTDLGDLSRDSLHASPEVTRALWSRSSRSVSYTLGALSVELDFGTAPVVVPGTAKDVGVRLHNSRAAALVLDLCMQAPQGWTVDPAASHCVEIGARESVALNYRLQAGEPAVVENSNRAFLTVAPRGRPAEPAVPVVLVGARQWLLWGPQGSETEDADLLLDRAFAPEEDQAVGQLTALTKNERAQAGWRVDHADGYALPASLGEDWTGVLYARLFLWSGEARAVRLGVPATCPRRLWLNSALLHEARDRGPLRPNYGGDHASYVDTALQLGWNEVLIKYARDAAGPPFAAHFMLSTTGLHHGIVDVCWTRFPWEDTPDAQPNGDVSSGQPPDSP